MKTDRLLKSARTALLAAAAFCLAGCLEEQHPGTYYTFSGQTIASELERRPEDFSEFIKVLKLASNNVWQELGTYGEHTLFAPYNACIEEFLKERSEIAGREYKTVEDLYKYEPKVIDTLAATHLMDITCYVGEMKAGIFPKCNMNDKYLTLSFDSAINRINGTDTVYSLLRCLNKFSHIVERDDTCTNGVLHTIDKCINFKGSYVYDLLESNPETYMFAEALKLTGLSYGKNNLLSKWKDDTYKIGDDSVGTKTKVKITAAGTAYPVSYWAEKKTCYTVFAVKDEILKEKCVLKNGNHVANIEDLMQYAKEVYDEVFPDDKDITDLTDRRNSFNRFISYHILPFACGPSNFNTNQLIITTFNAGITDPEDYFETLSPRTLMRISTAKTGNNQYDKVYINRLGTEGDGTVDYDGPYFDGARILGLQESGDVQQVADNGFILYVDNVLLYDKTTRDRILNRRLRIDCATLSPDFITSGARQNYFTGSASNRPGFGFRDATNFSSINGDYIMSVRPVNETTSYAYEGDGIDIQGNFDICIKLPPVPYDGTWQLRLSMRGRHECGIVQVYLGTSATGTEDPTEWEPLGIPTDLRCEDYSEDPTVGWKKDSDIGSDDLEAIDAVDKAMKNLGWMKGPDSQMTSDGKSHRDVKHMARRILMTNYLRANTHYYLRIKQILQGVDSAEFLFDYIEFVPKKVYDNNEDKH
jgi:hypothetical protein